MFKPGKDAQGQYPVEQAVWSLNLAAMFLPKALAILCSEYLHITGNNDLSNKGGLFFKRRGNVSEIVTVIFF